MLRSSVKYSDGQRSGIRNRILRRYKRNKRSMAARPFDAKRTHMPGAFDRLRDNSMMLPTQAVLPTITNRAELPDVFVQ